MALPVENYQRFCKQVTLGTGDTTKEVMPAVTGVQYVLTTCSVVGLVAAAQTVYVGDSSGTNKIVSLANSFTVHAQIAIALIEGLKCVVGESIVVKPGAAGPSVHAVVEGYILKTITS